MRDVWPMKKETFDKIVKNMVFPCMICASKKLGIANIDIKPDFCDLVYKKYESMKEEYHKYYMKKKKEGEKIDRHKISAIFYVAFVEGAKERKFADFRKIPRDIKLPFVHNLAFNISMSILESFIISNNGKKIKAYPKEYREHLKTKGIMTELNKYKKYTLNEFILAQKYGKLSPLLLANIFYLIEHNSANKFLKLYG